MTSIQHDGISQENQDISTNPQKKQKKKNKKQKKKSGFFSYLYLFSFVFLGALWFLSYVIKSYSPEIDVTIGDNEAFTLSDSDVNMEIKTIDERLKWIQMEDELPSVSIRGFEKPDKNKNSDKLEKDRKQIKDEQKKSKDLISMKPPIPKISEIKKQSEEFKNIPTKDIISNSNVVPKQRTTITKVYLGNYATFDDAIEVQNKIKSIDTSISPFVKSVKGHYIVQLGSFSDSDRAGVLVEKISKKGYYPKITYEN